MQYVLAYSILIVAPHHTQSDYWHLTHILTCNMSDMCKVTVFWLVEAPCHRQSDYWHLTPNLLMCVMCITCNMCNMHIMHPITVFWLVESPLTTANQIISISHSPMCTIHMSHFAYACKMRYPLNLVLESWEYLWFY